MISYTDSCNCSDSSDIELSDEWVGKKSPKLSRGNRSPKHVWSYINVFYFSAHFLQQCFFIIPSDFMRCKNVSLFPRLNMESRKSPKLSRANQEGQRSPRLPTKKPPVRSPSLTRREFSMDGITEVMTCQIQCTAKYYSSCSLASNTVVPALLSLCNSQQLMLQYVFFVTGLPYFF